MAINFVDVFKETRNNALSGLFIITFWLLSSTSYYEALSRQQLLQYLTAYLILNEAYQTQASCHNEESCRLYISFPWAGKPDDLYFKVVESHAPLAPNRVLRRTETLGNTNLPFSRFLLVAEQRDYYVATGITIALVVNRANKFEIENTWSLLRPWFAARGYSTTQLKNVNSTDPAIAQAIIEYVAPNASPTINVFGLSTPMLYLPFILGALLLVNVALLIGNLSTTADMIRAPPTDDFGWVILYTGQGLFGWLCRIATIVLIVGVLAVPALAIVASGRHIFDRIAASRGATASTVGNQLLLIDLPTTWIYICVVVFTAVIVANFVMHIRLKTAIKKARGSGLP